MKKGISKYQTSLTRREQTRKRRDILQRTAVASFCTAYSYGNGFNEMTVHRVLFGGYATDHESLMKNKREVKVIVKHLIQALKLPFVWLRGNGNTGELKLCVPYHDWEWDQWEDHQVRITSGLQAYIKNIKALRVNIPDIGLVDTQAKAQLIDDSDTESKASEEEWLKQQRELAEK